MFIVTTIFLAGLVFAVQQIMFKYVSVDPKTGFSFDDYGIIKGVRDASNMSLASSADCAELEQRMASLKAFLERRSSAVGYSLNLDYRIDCTRFGNSPQSPAPLNVTVRVISSRTDSSSGFLLYGR